MALLSIEELSRELSVSLELIEEMISKEVLTPYGGRARLGEPRFSSTSISDIRKQIQHFNVH